MKLIVILSIIIVAAIWIFAIGQLALAKHHEDKSTDQLKASDDQLGKKTDVDTPQLPPGQVNPGETATNTLESNPRATTTTPAGVPAGTISEPFPLPPTVPARMIHNGEKVPDLNKSTPPVLTTLQNGAKEWRYTDPYGQSYKFVDGTNEWIKITDPKQTEGAPLSTPTTPNNPVPNIENSDSSTPTNTNGDNLNVDSQQSDSSGSTSSSESDSSSNGLNSKDIRKLGEDSKFIMMPQDGKIALFSIESNERGLDANVLPRLIRPIELFDSVGEVLSWLSDYDNR